MKTMQITRKPAGLYRKIVWFALVMSCTLFGCKAEIDQGGLVTDMGRRADGLIVKYRQTNLDSYEGRVLLSNVRETFGVDLTVVRTLATHAQVLNVANGGVSFEDLKAMAAFLEKDPQVVYAEPNKIMHIWFEPNDPDYSKQWHHFEDNGGMRMPEAWDKANGNGVVVAVIDSGITYHSDLNANILPGYDFISNSDAARDGDGRDGNPQDEGDWLVAGDCEYNSYSKGSSWHGTHVAGIVAAVANNNKGVTGVAHKAKILPVRVVGKCGGTLADITDGIIWASGGEVPGVPNNQNPAQVINLSFGSEGACSKSSQNAINIARKNGATVVAAAGNTIEDASNFDPTSCVGVITVTATNRKGKKASYSNYGAVIDMAAPGGVGMGVDGIYSTANSGATTPSSESYTYYQGTSMAAPQVAGVAALLYQKKPNISSDDVIRILSDSARDFLSSCSRCGAGIVDGSAAVDLVVNGIPPITHQELTKDETISISGEKGQWKHFWIDVPADASSLVMKMSGGSGDADLYTRCGMPAVLDGYDCRPWKNSNDEECAIGNPPVGKYYLSIYAAEAFSGVNLVASFVTGGPVAQYDLQVNTIGEGSVSLNPPGGTYNMGTMVTLTATPATGWEFANWSGGLSGKSNPATISIYGHTNVTAVFLRPGPPPGGQLVNKQIVAISGEKSQWKHFSIDVPSGASNLSMKIWGGSGDADLFTRFGSEPDSSNYDCRPYKVGSDEECNVPDPQVGKYYLSIKGFLDYSNVNLMVSFEID